MTCTGPDRCGIIECSRLSDGTYTESPLIKCPYFVIVVGPVWSNDPVSYASGSISTDRASPGWELGHETISPAYKISLLRSLIMDAGWTIVVKYHRNVIRTMRDDG